MDRPASSNGRQDLVYARAVAVALAYAALASVWIVSSDLLVSAILNEPGTLTWANTAKGIAFVLVTTASLFLVLVHFGRLGQVQGQARVSGEGVRRRSRLLVFSMLLLFVAVGGLGLKSLVDQGRASGVERLDLLAQSVASQASEWHDARTHQLELLAGEQQLDRQLRAWLTTQDARLEASVRERLAALQEITGGAAVMVLDETGRPRLWSGAPRTVGRPLERIRREALDTGEVMQTGFYSLESSGKERVYLDLVAPQGAEGARKGMSLVLRFDARALTLPGFLRWSLGGGELRTWLVSRGSGVVMAPGLSEEGGGLRRDGNGQALNAALDASAAHAGASPVLQWRDADGTRFLGMSQAVPGTDLVVVAAFDERQLLDSIGDELLWAGMVLLMALLGGLTALGAWQIQRRAAAGEAQARAREQIDAERLQRLAISERYRDLMENARDIILLFDDEGRIIEANQAAEQAYGLSREVMLTRSITDLRAPETLHSLDEEWQAADDRQGVLFETRHRRSDGTTFPVEVSSQQVMIDGRACRQSIVRDISERRATMQRLDADARLLAIAGRMTHFGGWWVDLQTRETYWSDEVCRIHGMPPGTRLNAEEGIEFYAPESRERIRAVFTACTLEGIPYDEELQIVDRQGVHRWVRTVGEAVRDEGGRIVAVQGAFQDVTEDHEARARLEASEQALRAREQQLHLLIEHSPAALAMFDRDMNYLATSRRWRETYGRGEQEQVGVSHYAVFPEISTSRRWAHRRALAGEVVRAEEDRIDWADGRKQWLTWEARPWLDADGVVGGIIIFSLDVTDQYLARQKLSLQARRAEVLLALPRHAESLDEQGFMQQAQEMAEELTGSQISFVHFVHEDEETIELVTWSRRTLEEYCQATHDSHYPISKAGIWADALRQRAPVVINDYPGHSDGKGLPEGHCALQRLVSVPVIEHGRVVMLAGVGNKETDYTDLDVETVRLIAEQVWRIVQRRRSEAHLRQLSLAVEQSPESVVITDLDARILYVNESFKQVTGYTAEEVLGKNPRMLQSGRTPETHYEQMWRCLTAGRPWKGEFYNRRKDGTEFIELGHVAPLRQPDGRITHYVAVKDDITEKKKLAGELDRHRHRLESLVAERTAELEEARSRADAANRAKSAFLANMSHEIRTPLNAIVGLIYLLREACQDEPQRRKLTQIDKSARHLLAIINDILDLSKIEAGKLQLETRDFHLSAVLDHIRSVLTEAVRGKGLTLTIDPDSVPHWLRGDPTRLRQALLNLVGNAVKFTEQGGITLRARVVSREDRQLQVRFEVEDSGVGIPEDRIARLFQPFEQADSSTTREYGGTGLGLAITHRLVELMGGSISVESREGEGSLFRVDVPLALGEGSPPRISSHTEEALFDRSAFKRYRGARVLLAEDNAVNREVAAELIGQTGLKLDTAEDGLEALKQLERKSYDVVLLDVQMPRLDGLGVARRMRDMPDYGTTPILAMTANVFEDDRQAALEAGMNDFIPKPVDPVVLYRKLLRWLSAHPESDSESRVDQAPGADGAVVLDEQRGLGFLGGNREAYLSLLRRLVNEHRADPERLLGLLAEDRYDSVRMLAHGLKGAAATLGAGEVADLAARIERETDDHQPREALVRACRALDEAMDRLTARIAELSGVPAEPAVGRSSGTRPAGEELLRSLESALASDDVDAIEIIARHEARLSVALGAERFGRIAHQVRDYDFPGALKHLREVLDSGGPAGGADRGGTAETSDT
ncbi:MAG: PAS domain S-box protein [Halothiobacillaceae bacterium]